ncbi:translation initiation factor 2 [Subdoligranulum variabile]|uniref:translation initiation factor 2 n=1 Tax=Subdoligranulum variabile TaxID=214851 RepID=UPI002942B5E4|nr:translation initiation factor 2 [Subdoligranulum variabile]
MSKLTVTLPDDLHAQIRQELEAQGITTGQFIEMVVTKYFTKSKEGENNMATRTIAFQVSEELYQRIKEYLNRYQEVYGRKLTQREFMLQLIEDALSEAEEEFEAATAAEDEAPEAEEGPEEEAPDCEVDTEDADAGDTNEDDDGESPAEASGEGYTPYTNEE